MINAIYRYISSIINYSVIFDIEGKEGRKENRADFSFRDLPKNDKSDYTHELHRN